MRHRIKQAIAVLAIVLSVIVVSATPAHATVYWGCPAGQGCLWVDHNGGGARLSIAFSVAKPNVCHNLPAQFNDTASSASADYGSGYAIYFYEDPNCGVFGDIDEEYLESTDYVWFYDFNDEISSYMIRFP